MIINGEGGVEKSQVIQFTTELFHACNVPHLLRKNAYTGVTALLIKGQTCHTSAMISRQERSPSSATKAKLQHFWQDVLYDITDEYSMLGKTFIARMSVNLVIGKCAPVESSHSFSDLNVILFGDPHQFPPVGCSIHEALFFPTDSQHDSTTCQVGQEVYLKFTMVVTLKQQIHVIDPIWQNFLHHLRHGHVERHHIDMLHSLVLAHADCTSPDFTSLPWKNTMLITPRHGVRNQWNSTATHDHCHLQCQSLFAAHTHDSINHRPLIVNEHTALRNRLQSSKKDNNMLPEIVELAIGMRVMVTCNLDTDLDIILPAAMDLHYDKCGVIHLPSPPEYILVKLDHTRASTLPGLDTNVIPIEAMTKTC